MMKDLPPRLQHYVSAIQSSGLTIYEPIEVGDPTLWIPTLELEEILDTRLKDFYLGEIPLRTRSKRIKQLVCKALGYPVPDSFKKTTPRFPGQRFDTYGQKSNNLQIWNEDLEPSRRYVLIGITDKNVVYRVRVVNGDDLAILDTTQTLTQKYQASIVPGLKKENLITPTDTEIIASIAQHVLNDLPSNLEPTQPPEPARLMSIQLIFDRLKGLVGSTIEDQGRDQERSRGAELHRIICYKLGYHKFRDDGRFPDIRHQLLEVKFQTSPTVDLGLVKPDSPEQLDISQLSGHKIRHCDIRYAIFYGTVEKDTVKLTHFFLTTGQHFFSQFRLLQGKILNKKLQIPLPSDFFTR